MEFCAFFVVNFFFKFVTSCKICFCESLNFWFFWKLILCIFMACFLFLYSFVTSSERYCRVLPPLSESMSELIAIWAKIANWSHVTCNTYNIRYTISTYITQRSPGSPQFSSVPIEVPFLQPLSLTLLSPASMIRIWSIPCFTLIDKCQPGSKWPENVLPGLTGRHFLSENTD